VGERTGSGRPPELTTADLDTPLGEALLFLHRHVVMDVSERAAAGAGGGGDVTRDEAAGNDGTTTCGTGSNARSSAGTRGLARMVVFSGSASAEAPASRSH